MVIWYGDNSLKKSLTHEFFPIHHVSLHKGLKGRWLKPTDQKVIRLTASHILPHSINIQA